MQHCFLSFSTQAHGYIIIQHSLLPQWQTHAHLYYFMNIVFSKKKYFMNISYNNIAMHTHELVDPFQMPTKGEFETSSCCLLPLPLWRWGLQKKNMGGASCFSVVQGGQAHLTRTCREMTQNYVTSYRNWKKIQITFSINSSWKQWQQKPVTTIKNATIADHVISLLLCQASHRPFLHLDKNGRLGCSVCFVLFQGTHQYLHRWTSDSWTHCWTCRRMEESDCKHDTYIQGRNQFG